MKLIYTGPYEGVDVPLPSGDAVYAERNKEVEIPDDLAEGLLVQEDIWADPNAKEAPAAPPAPEKATRELAAELGVDLEEVEGSGKDGRIVQKDVKAAAKAAEEAAAAGGSQEENNQPGEGATEEA